MVAMNATIASDTTETQRAERLARLAQRRPVPTSVPAATVGNGPEARAALPRTTPRRRPAKGAKFAALTLSVVSAGGLTAMFAHADKAAATTVKTSTSTLTNGTYAGATSTNKWGGVQVKVTVAGGKITNVTTLKTPAGHRKSVAINSRAVPVLKAEALAAQSASIDNVSGATYTTDSYKISLQSAIDQAKGATTAATA